MLAQRSSRNAAMCMAGPFTAFFTTVLPTILRSHKDYASHLPEMSRRILRFAARRVPDRPAEPELLEVVERLFDGTALASE